MNLHLLRATGSKQPDYPIAGSNIVERATYDDAKRRVWINADQHFEGVSAQVWNYHIGGYQVAHKWLKDRLLTFNELDHYRRVVAALEETVFLQAEIDAAIPKWPIE